MGTASIHLSAVGMKNLVWYGLMTAPHAGTEFIQNRALSLTVVSGLPGSRVSQSFGAGFFMSAFRRFVNMTQGTC